MMTAKPKTIRCAIYTRKSSEEGLDQVYNSLDAQRDACAAYVMSQVGEGWILLPAPYDDGGFSGGNLVRPALKRLLADIEAGRIDVVVVYKVDRLTRSLGDFARIVDVLDKCGASFVSVTQAFNTTTSMGRLTLNVLLSFAQFEREVTGERIRDKIAASKKLGMWMGGNVPLGYRPSGRTLVIEPDEAETVRHIFARYLELGSVHLLALELAAHKVTSKVWATAAGKARGGRPINRGALFHLLRNRTYLGEIPHKGASYPGQHPAIISPDIFETVQRKLDETATTLKPNRPAHKSGPHKGAPLKGVIFDGSGERLSPVSARRKGGATYRYYVSRALQTGTRQRAGPTDRIPAGLVEDLIIDRLRRLGFAAGPDAQADWADLRGWIARVEVSPSATTLHLSSDTERRLGDANAILQRLHPEDQLITDGECLKIIMPLQFVRRRGVTAAINPNGGGAICRPRLDAALSSALVRAEAWKRKLFAGEVATVDELARSEQMNPTYASRMLRVAFLAPELKRAILDGRQPQGLTLQAVVTRDVPLSWQGQRALFGR